MTSIAMRIPIASLPNSYHPTMSLKQSSILGRARTACPLTHFLTRTPPSHFGLTGLGSARAVNRRYISDCVPLKTRLKASAAFVSASALGMACGPALAGVLQVNKSFLGITLNQNTLPGWVMAILWFVYLLWLWISFKEPLREDEEDQVAQAGSKDKSVGMDSSSWEGVSVALLLNTVLFNLFTAFTCAL
eukprot:Gb_27488 [translate_table: standard]